jgi:hypothetical protein
MQSANFNDKKDKQCMMTLERITAKAPLTMQKTLFAGTWLKCMINQCRRLKNIRFRSAYANCVITVVPFRYYSVSCFMGLIR